MDAVVAVLITCALRATVSIGLYGTNKGPNVMPNALEHRARTHLVEIFFQFAGTPVRRYARTGTCRYAGTPVRAGTCRYVPVRRYAFPVQRVSMTYYLL